MKKFDDVYEVVKLIPKGRVTSYGAIAKYLSTGARLVGWAMNASHGLGIPAHRVVNHKGVLTGKNHFENPNIMQQLLESEGLTIKKDQIVNFIKYFWDPSTELNI
jgi:methylated-DNA-protein-cysteine methyltransferase-like protein